LKQLVYLSLRLKVNKLSGIYIHIPFCKQACHYCDFHFSTNFSRSDEMVDMICRELELRSEYLPKGMSVNTVYFGGGTPSLLSASQIEKILKHIHDYYQLDLKEITLEANPDDLHPKKLENWKALGLDRLSIGIQTFDAEILRFYNRAHTAQESLNAIKLAKSAGFQKLSIDLIYGFPSDGHKIWKNDLKTALDQDPGHISSYCLTVEPKTALGNWEKKGKYTHSTEDFAAVQFEMLMESMEKPDMYNMKFPILENRVNLLFTIPIIGKEFHISGSDRVHIPLMAKSGASIFPTTLNISIA
jgi:oxygen-independent coproporphyrinogen III oxidase